MASTAVGRLTYEHVNCAVIVAHQDDETLWAGGTLLMQGRGDTLSALPALCGSWWCVLVRPRFGVSTAEAYAGLSPADFSDGEATSRMCSALAAGVGGTIARAVEYVPAPTVGAWLLAVLHTGAVLVLAAMLPLSMARLATVQQLLQNEKLYLRRKRVTLS